MEVCGSYRVPFSYGDLIRGLVHFPSIIEEWAFVVCPTSGFQCSVVRADQRSRAGFILTMVKDESKCTQPYDQFKSPLTQELGTLLMDVLSYRSAGSGIGTFRDPTSRSTLPE